MRSIIGSIPAPRPTRGLDGLGAVSGFGASPREAPDQVRGRVKVWTISAIGTIRTALLACLLAAPAVAAERTSTLSEGDVAALRDGQGWGLAKPAEMNGWPGPRHVLDLGTELGLDAGQRTRIQAIFDAMQAEARRLGPPYIEAEKALDTAFLSGGIDPVRLDALLAEAAAARAALRAVHLRAHMATAPLLTRHQRHMYMRLRGHGGAHHGHGKGHGHE